MGERRGTKGLELWCRRMTEGYPGVNVVNMTTSWRDGLAFCAIIHHFRPDLIEFSKLNKDDIYYNNELAFRVAERHLGIPALLEPEDMVEFPVPDRLSILTYLSQFYQTFVVGQGKSPTRVPSKRPATPPEHGIVSPTSTSPPTKVSGKVRREPCAKCGLPVFIAERLNVGKLLYHRTCFRCARCSSQLTLANYYETENNDFCCETCPDEEKSSLDTSSVLTRSLSDEEKSASLKKNEDTDDYSFKFETALEFPEDDSLKRDSTLNSSRYTNARSLFVHSQVEDLNSDSGTEDVPPDLPGTEPPCENELSESGFPNDKLKSDVNIESSVSLGSAGLGPVESHVVVTKDTISAEGNKISLVKARMRLFECKSDAPNEIHSVNNQVPLKNSFSGNRDVDVSDSRSFKNDISNEDASICESPLKEDASEEINDSAVDKSDTGVEGVKENNDISVVTISDSSKDPSSDYVIDGSVITISDSNDNSSLRESDDSAVKHKTTQEEKNNDDDVSVKEEKVASKLSEDTETITKAIQPSPRKSEVSEEYPDDLNPFGDEEEENNETGNKNISLNPFEDDENEEITPPSPQRPPKKKTKPSTNESIISDIHVKRISANPFEEDDNEDKTKEIPQPAKRKIIAPKISLNPFWNDDDENEQDEKPVPKPRTSKSSLGAPEPRPRESTGSSTTFSSLSSVASTQSGYTLRKKKPAPKPPSVTESGPSSLTSSPSHSVTQSPRGTPKVRKAKKAPPPPPAATSTPLEPSSTQVVDLGDDFEREKFAKDETNRNRQSQNLSLHSPSSSDNSSSLGAPNKSTFGKWKRRKGQAPSRPIPQKRVIKSLPMVEVRRELEIIEIQQQGLEKQGVRLEQIIRERCEGPDVNPDESLPPEIEEMVLQLFELVNEKNELFRRQAELMYLRRQHKLEEQHADIEYQIRCLMLQPEANKTDSDKAREEELINRLVEIVERRNEIIECLEMDRVREAEEDDSINNQLNLYTLKKDDKSVEKMNEKKEKKKNKKEKKFKLKGCKVDADKDIDESESSATLVKDKKKKKFNIF